jgi:hypothetical protein
MRTTKRIKNLSQTAESRLKGTGLLSKQQAFRRSGVSHSTFIRALSINFKGQRPSCGMVRMPGLKAIHYKVGKRWSCVAIDPADLERWKRQRKNYNLANGSKKKKRSQSIPKIGDQARRRTNGSAR